MGAPQLLEVFVQIQITQKSNINLKYVRHPMRQHGTLFKYLKTNQGSPPAEMTSFCSCLPIGEKFPLEKLDDNNCFFFVCAVERFR